VSKKEYPGVMPSFNAALLSGLGLEETGWRTEFLNEWARCESCVAGYNPLATTRWARHPSLEEPLFNSHGVRQFKTLQAGVDATLDTLNNGLYPSVVAALTEQRFDARGQTAEELRKWGTMAFASEIENGWEPTATGTSAPLPPILPPALSLEERFNELVLGVDSVRRDTELALYRANSAGALLTANDGSVFDINKMNAAFDSLTETIESISSRIDAMAELLVANRVHAHQVSSRIDAMADTLAKRA